MTIKRIDLFLPPESQYGVIYHFTEKLSEALQNQKVKTRILQAKKKDPRPFLEALFKDPPDCTLSFNGLLPDQEGRFFCDMIQTPHVACLTDSPNHFFSLVKSPYTIIACVDRFFCDFFRTFSFENVLFMPHGVEREVVEEKSDHKREYDVVMLSSFIDYELVRSRWKTQYSHAIVKALDEAAEITLADDKTSFLQAFTLAIDHQMKKGGDIDPRQLNFEDLLSELETYIRGKDRIELVKAIKDADLHIFGSQEGGGWAKYLKKSDHVKIHGPVPYEHAIEVMKRTKILLNSTPSLKQGGHERVFAGLGAGALVLSNANTYLKENFKDEEDILFYEHNKWDQVSDKVLRYLRDEPLRREVVSKGHAKVLKDHTWDNRARSLIQGLGPLLKKIK